MGCTSEAAKAARRRIRKLRAAGAHPSAFTHNVGTVRRLQALAVLGWPCQALGQHLGCSEQAVERMRSGRIPTVYVRTAARIAALYDELSMTPGPSALTAERSRAKGWLPPLAWDERALDVPEAAPASTPTPWRAPMVPVDRDEVARLTAKGRSVAQIAAALGAHRRSVQRVRAQLRAELEEAS
jgi:hypothetical protein